MVLIHVVLRFRSLNIWKLGKAQVLCFGDWSRGLLGPGASNLSIGRKKSKSSGLGWLSCFRRGLRGLEMLGHSIFMSTSLAMEDHDTQRLTTPGEPVQALFFNQAERNTQNVYVLLWFKK